MNTEAIDSIVNISSTGNGVITVNKEDCSYSVRVVDTYSISELEELKQNLKDEYENKLQREKVHIGRRDDLTGHRIHGRRRKITVPKGSFRNKKGIIGEAINS